MHNLPNIITSFRLVAAVLLILVTLSCSPKPPFLPLFITAAVSDMLDGLIARRFNWCTEFGAQLDSVSDLTLYGAVFLFFLFNTAEEMRQCLPLLIAGGAVQLLHWRLCVMRHGQFPSYHSTFSRICAYSMFFGTIAFWFTHITYILGSMLIAWIACSAEGIAITMLLRAPKQNVSSIRAAMQN